MNSLEVVSRLQELEVEISRAAKKVGKSRQDITLLLVSKRIPIELVLVAVEQGYRSFGENYVQAALKRFGELQEANKEIEPHLIGKLQTNKVKYAVGFFDLIQTLDSVKLLKCINEEALSRGIVQRLLVQVNISRDPAKSGVIPEETQEVVQEALSLDGVRIEGFMTIGQFGASVEKRRAEFSALRSLRDEVAYNCSIPLKHLSMGMSDDYSIAIEEGASIVRVGSAVFGSRD